MAKQNKKLPSDSNKRAKSIVDSLTGNKDKKTVDPDVSEAARALGRKGGLKGGNARAASLTAEERTAIAKKGAAARWNKNTDQ